jgi:hypothetical protein
MKSKRTSDKVNMTRLYNFISFRKRSFDIGWKIVIDIQLMNIPSLISNRTCQSVIFNLSDEKYFSEGTGHGNCNY